MILGIGVIYNFSDMDGINKKLFKVENIPETAEYDEASLEFDTVSILR